MAFWTYMLRCSDRRYYTGHTDDLERPIGQHQVGHGSQFSRRRLPVTLAGSETSSSRIEALEAEQTVGGWSRGKKQALVAGNRSLLSLLARPPRERMNSSSPRLSASLETSGIGSADEA